MGKERRDEYRPKSPAELVNESLTVWFSKVRYPPMTRGHWETAFKEPTINSLFGNEEAEPIE